MSQFSQWKTIGYAAAIFVAGGISGGSLGVYEAKSRLFSPPGEREMALHMRNRLQARLGLTPEQMAKINPIVENAASELRSIRVETAQRLDKVFEDSYAQVSAVLTPEQRPKLDEMLRERRAMMQAHWQEGRRQHGLGIPGGPRYDGPGPQPSAP
jgi:Spy/CpxP family protein refolding chaperone